MTDGEGSGEGLAAVEAARGRLVHRVALSQGRVRLHQIVVPTEWNFHLRGIAAQALTRLPVRSAGDYAAQARAVICAIDPCIAYHLDISPHA